MGNLKKRIGLIIIILFFLILAGASIWFIFSDYYTNFPYISKYLDQNLDINNKSIKISLISLSVLLIIIILIIFFSLRKLFKISKEEKVKSTYFRIKEAHTRANTDLDALYSILKEHKKIKINEISKTFKVGEDKAIEWAKILENNNLASIQYPSFSEPFLEIKSEEEEK
jgi:hypothetical protein